MENKFFERPILNSPYESSARHWELDANGQPTQNIIDKRRRADFITPISKPKKHKTPSKQGEIVFDEGLGLSTIHINFNTSKRDRWETDSRRCHINWVVIDSDREAEFFRVAEAHPRVKAYVKNHNLGVEQKFNEMIVAATADSPAAEANE